MPFRFYKKSDVIAGAIMFGGFALLLVLLAVFSDYLPISRIRIDGVFLTPDHPDFVRYLSLLRFTAAGIALVCVALCWLLFRYSRRVADT